MDMIINQKMTIRSFSDPRFEQELRDAGPFVVHVNPTQYTKSTQIHFSEEQAPGTSANQNNFNNTEPVKLNFDFLLDRTGALGNLPDLMNGVDEDIARFKKVSIDYEGEIHKPRYLILSWGSLLFKCQLEKLDIEYKLFDKEGKPLRASLKCSFREFKEDTRRVAEENRSSPDLSHYREVKAGENLQLLCERIYGDPAYYRYVAEVNNLAQFRRIKEGTLINFPPIETIPNAR